MRKLGALGLAFILGAVTWMASTTARTVSAQGEPPVKLVQWEYTWTSGLNPDQFNKLGAEGWELCVSAREGAQAVPTFVFKRPKR